jgi:hypothetical protein
MTGVVEWSVLIFVCGLLFASIVMSTRATLALAKRDTAIALLEKDVRHTKANVAQHAAINSEMQQDVAVLKKQVERHDRLINGKSHR